MPYLNLFIVQTIVIVLIGITHVSALQWSLYWHYIWLDVPVHFAGGLWLALAGSWMLLRGGQRMEVSTVFSMVVFLGVAWEVFELAAGVPMEENFALDTVIDLTMDVLGGVFGFIIAKSLARHDTISLNEEAETSSS
jgi:hypothetical protein